VQAKETFAELLKRWPTRLQGIDLYSTVLWHLRDRDALQALAHSTVRLHGHAPISLCVVANSCSLRNDHETALKYLAAATAKDPSYVYAHTLAGHEALAIGDFDQAIQNFRQALKIDSRHYNALYGLGTVFLKQECLDVAESHFLKALELNKYSAVLFCYLGMVQHGLKRFESAIDTLNKASELDPANPQAMYQRALVYISVGKLEVRC
jgi:anaphase-promoting complex subunit 3